jgi:DNA-binding FadR family transcriptional regulator
MEVAAMSANQWANLIANHVSMKKDKVPKDWKTMRQLCEELKIPRTTLRDKLHKYVADGFVEVKKFRVPVGLRKIYLTEHYKICK